MQVVSKAIERDVSDSCKQPMSDSKTLLIHEKELL